MTAVMGQRDWTCPDCWEAIPLRMMMSKPRMIGRTQASMRVTIDDTDIRAHILMHELCLCAWETHERKVFINAIVRRDRVRVYDERCPIHEDGEDGR